MKKLPSVRTACPALADIVHHIPDIFIGMLFHAPPVISQDCATKQKMITKINYFFTTKIFLFTVPFSVITLIKYIPCGKVLTSIENRF